MTDKPNVVILGGGMGGLAAAWELSRGPWRDRLGRITVYQRGWRLGGKGASSRGVHGRIEEHGLHVLLGYYDTTFRMMREVYAELDRPSTNPDAPILSWDDAVAPAQDVGLADHHRGEWDHFVTRFSANDAVPGESAAEPGALSPLEVAMRSVRLLLDFHAGEETGRGVVLSPSSEPPLAGGAATAVRSAAFAGVAAAAVVLEQAMAAGVSMLGATKLAEAVEGLIEPFRRMVADGLGANPGLRRTWNLVDLVLANVRGLLADGLIGDDGFASIDHLDYREWIRSHGAAESTVDSPILRGMYDLVFAYTDGDPERPAFSAGLGLDLSTRMLFGYRGSIFWKMQAGMGEVIFAPLYEALARRGVDFEFFHRVDEVRPSPGGESIEAIELARQVDLAPGVDRYRPLVDVGGLPCWTAAPDAAQLAAAPAGNLESLWVQHDDAARFELAVGRDFDAVVFAISLGMVPYVCGGILDQNRAWRDMVRHVRTVPTQAFQLWLAESEEDLGWNGPRGVTLSGFVQPFDTWASMSHLIERESWPESDTPRSIAYFCSVLPEPDGTVAGRDAALAADRRVASSAASFLERDVAALWPAAVDEQGFRWGLLTGSSGEGVDALAAQYLSANTDPSDRYVQSVPGSGRYRLKPGASGYGNLALAGDWTDCGLNAGCVEAAAMSGVLAAEAIAAMFGDDGPSP